MPRRLDPLALDHYLCYGYVPPPGRSWRERTSFRRLTMPSGMRVRSRSSVTGSPDWNLERERPIEEDVEELRATLGDAVREQMIADVPLGAFLSGGIDSTIIVGLDATSVEPAGEDLRDRLSRPEV